MPGWRFTCTNKKGTQLQPGVHGNAATVAWLELFTRVRCKGALNHLTPKVSTPPDSLLSTKSCAIEKASRLNSLGVFRRWSPPSHPLPALMMQPLLTPCQMVLTSALTPGPSLPCAFFLIFFLFFFFFFVALFFPSPFRSPPPPSSSFHEIQMPSLEACESAERGPNKSDWVVYHQRSNVNLAKPAAMAVVWREMRVITQTDRHKYTHTHTQGKKGGGTCKRCNSAIKGTNTHTHTASFFYFMITRLRRCFHVVSPFSAWCRQ